jgi:hypothetical protein
MLRSSLYTALITGALALGACHPFRSPMKQDPVVQVSSRDANANARWHGTLTSPSSLAGAVQMTGQISMAPAETAGNTHVVLLLANASPGGLHPWQVRRGQCGMDEGVFGTPENYNALKVDDGGRSSVTANVPLAMPSDGRYFVSVGASEANASTIVACGNLASPTQ